MATLTNNLERITILPITVYEIQGVHLPSIVISTPHRGEVEVKLKETHYPFLFGSVSQIEKGSEQVIQEIKEIEKESINFLLEEWVQNNIKSLQTTPSHLNPLIEKECEYCNKLFMPKKRISRYCSTKCSAQDRASKR